MTALPRAGGTVNRGYPVRPACAGLNVCRGVSGALEIPSPDGMPPDQATQWPGTELQRSRVMQREKGNPAAGMSAVNFCPIA